MRRGTKTRRSCANAPSTRKSSMLRRPSSTQRPSQHAGCPGCGWPVSHWCSSVWALGAYYFWTLLGVGSRTRARRWPSNRPVSPTRQQPATDGGVAQTEPPLCRRLPVPPDDRRRPVADTVDTTGGGTRWLSPSARSGPTVSEPVELRRVGAETTDRQLPQDSLMEAFLLAQQEAPTSGDLTPLSEPSQETDVAAQPGSGASRRTWAG